MIRFCPAFLSSAFILVLLMMLSAFLSYAFGRISDYKEKLHHILDTSKEHAIIMHERNQALIEKQNADIHAATLSERSTLQPCASETALPEKSTTTSAIC